MIIFIHEVRLNIKTMLIWGISIGVLCFGCLVLYKSLGDSLDQMADMYSKLGTFSTAMGMDKLGINTIEGYYATEIAIMFALGAAMFASLMGITMLSKEEEGHTSEFLNTLPVSRVQIVLCKYAAVAAMIIGLNLICILASWLGFAVMDGGISGDLLFLYHGSQLLMQLEIGSICFCISACYKRKMVGLGLGLVILFYAADIMCRIVPDLKWLKYITPFYYANASDIFSSEKLVLPELLIGIFILMVTVAASAIIYNKRDLS